MADSRDFIQRFKCPRCGQAVSAEFSGCWPAEASVYCLGCGDWFCHDFRAPSQKLLERIEALDDGWQDQSRTETSIETGVRHAVGLHTPAADGRVIPQPARPAEPAEFV